MIVDHPASDDRQITHRGDMLRIRQTRRVHKDGIGHAHAAGFFVHGRHKRRLAARDCFGQGNRGIVARLNNHALDELIDRDGLAGLDKHP